MSRCVARESDWTTTATQKQLLDIVEATRKQNLELHDEVAYLKRQALLGKDGAIEEMQLRNRLLQQKVGRLCRKIMLQQNVGRRQIRGCWRRGAAVFHSPPPPTPIFEFQF